MSSFNWWSAHLRAARCRRFGPTRTRDQVLAPDGWRNRQAHHAQSLRTGPATDQVLAPPPLAPLTSVPECLASAGSGAAPPAPSRREQGLAKLVLALLKLLHDLMEHQALRRVEGGSLSPADVEKLGDALMRQTQEIERLQREFRPPAGGT